MSFKVIIPARYASTRLPGKMLKRIGDKTMIEQVVCRANESNAEAVIVATDDARINEALEHSECQTVLTRADHASGSDRLAEVVDILELSDNEVVVNVQGDEPLIAPELINEVAGQLIDEPNASMATAARAIHEIRDFDDANVVKVVINQRGRALYFSRAGIPFRRDPDADSQATLAWHHIGIYAYRAGFLKQYQALESSLIEQSESLEQLRVLDHGYEILVHKTELDAGFGVDTQEDLERARHVFESRTD